MYVYQDGRFTVFIVLLRNLSIVQLRHCLPSSSCVAFSFFLPETDSLYYTHHWHCIYFVPLLFVTIVMQPPLPSPFLPIFSPFVTWCCQANIKSRSQWGWDGTLGVQSSPSVPGAAWQLASTTVANACSLLFVTPAGLLLLLLLLQLLLLYWSLSPVWDFGWLLAWSQQSESSLQAE